MLPGNPKRFATLPWLMTIMSHLERAIVEDKSDRILQMMVEKAQEDIEKRTDLGLPVPEEFITLTQRAIDILES
jgi:pseudouridine-5'-phosphate glycosidase